MEVHNADRAGQAVDVTQHIPCVGELQGSVRAGSNQGARELLSEEASHLSKRTEHGGRIVVVDR